MEYAERIGESKLRAIKDGFRFLRAILDAVLFFRPTRLYSLACTLCALVVLLLAASPTEFYLRHRALEEWMLYRFALCLLLTSGGFTLLCTSVVADDLFFLTRQRRRQSFSGRLLSRLCSSPVLLTLAALLTAASFVLVWPGLKEYALTQHVTLHWSRVLAAALGLLLALQCVITASLRRIVALWRAYLMGAAARLGVATS
ncbi:MAG TPA: hypothetical protein VM165_18195 [Planctomycetaceae bacterium]|nr:hypothetical protein [Planctomycetaceae bacterium]